MDIRKWGLSKIMQLPDSCFGQRWPIIFSDMVNTTATQYYISEVALPERCVIWQLFAWVLFNPGIDPTNLAISFCYKLGDEEPNAARWIGIEPLFNGVERRVLNERSLYPFAGVLNIRQAVHSSGRRICLRVVNPFAPVMSFCSGLVVSSIPNEVPDCLLSGNLRSP